MFCSNCGSETVSNSSFCSKCGTSLKQDQESETPHTAPNQGSDITSTYNQPTGSIQLPGGYVVARGEEVINDEEFRYSISQFWLQTRIVLTNRSLIWNQPNLILGFIPVGRKTGNISIAGVSSVSTNRRFSLKKFLWGFILFVFGLISLIDFGLLGMILGIIGISLLLSTIHSSFEVTYSGGGPTSLTASFTQTDKLEAFSNKVSQTIANTRK